MNIRELNAEQIEDAVARLFYEANHVLGDDVKRTLADCRAREAAPLAKSILGRLEENLAAAEELDIPVCQDTGMAVVFLEMGADVHVCGATPEEAINRGVRRAYLDGGMRCSVVADPLYDRRNTGDNTPAVIHTTIVPGDRVVITVAPKGFGSENMSSLKMFTPSASPEDIVAFVTDSVVRAGSNPCPPIVVGVGIGGTADYAAVLAKKALLRPLGQHHAEPAYADLECKMLSALNQTGIGPQGFGGQTTALAVNIEKYPTHIAGLPVAVNINCHVLRHRSAIL